jgi:hypothetical protein
MAEEVVSQEAAAASVVSQAAPTDGTGISWGAAGVGIAVGGAAGLLFAGGAVLSSRRRGHLGGTKPSQIAGV